MQHFPMTHFQRSTIWQAPVYLPYLQPELTDEALAAAEKKLGYRLPAEYIDLLRIQNGGYIRFEGLDGLNSQLFGIGPYFPNIEEMDWAIYGGELTIQLHGLVPVDGDGHWFLCLDYRTSEQQPRITWISTESDREERIADSFADYLDQMTLKTDNCYVLETTGPLEAMVHHLQDTLQQEWIGPDSNAHGYPQYQTRWNGSWIWISPNAVPRGFVRPGEKRYEELKEGMKGTALRYPELPAAALLVQVAEEGAGERLRELLKRSGIQLTPLAEWV